MATYVRELLGDLIVATTELVEAGAPPDERWRWLVVTSGIAARGPHDAADLVDAFGRLVWTSSIGDALRERPARTAPWSTRCLARSTLELLRELFPDRDLDTSAEELAMIAVGATAFAQVAPPDGIPEHHWWWAAPQPPGELRLNRRMIDLLALGATEVPVAFRRLVGSGFETPAGRIHLRGLAPTGLDADGDPTSLECQVNALSVEACLPRDDSRRPVDLAGSTLACARWLAAELRRSVPFRCRIVANVRRSPMASTLRFHRMRGPRWILDDMADEAEDGVLVLDDR